jgi:hypothetical protein
LVSKGVPLTRSAKGGPAREVWQDGVAKWWYVKGGLPRGHQRVVPLDGSPKGVAKVWYVKGSAKGSPKGGPLVGSLKGVVKGPPPEGSSPRGPSRWHPTGLLQGWSPMVGSLIGGPTTGVTQGGLANEGPPRDGS